MMTVQKEIGRDSMKHFIIYRNIYSDIAVFLLLTYAHCLYLKIMLYYKQ